MLRDFWICGRDMGSIGGAELHGSVVETTSPTLPKKGRERRAGALVVGGNPTLAKNSDTPPGRFASGMG
jgi:hypothetical protein